MWVLSCLCWFLCLFFFRRRRDRLWFDVAVVQSVGLLMSELGDLYRISWGGALSFRGAVFRSVLDFIGGCAQF